jgi:hypothetical protein
MMVFEATSSGATGSTSSEGSFARDRSRRGDLRHPTLVANAGLIAPTTLVQRLGLEALINAAVRLVGRVGGAWPGRKVLTLVATILAGGLHIDHADLLRAGSTERVLPFRVMAPSTLGTLFRSFTFGHIRQLDRLLAETLRRARGASARDRA